MTKLTTAAQAIARVRDGDTLLIGGFLQVGSPETLVNALLSASTAQNLTLVSNDSGTACTKTIQVMRQGRIKKVCASYIGANPLTQAMLLDDPASVELVPQGTLAERIRAGGAGIPGFYTPTGVGTMVEQGKEKRVIGGVECLLEQAIRGDVALVYATVADKAGNLFLRGTTKNFNALMARAANHVIAQAQQVVEVGDIDPELVTVPGIFVDAVVPAEEC